MAAPQPPAARPPEAPEARPPAKVRIADAKILGMIGAIIRIAGILLGLVWAISGVAEGLVFARGLAPTRDFGFAGEVSSTMIITGIAVIAGIAMIYAGVSIISDRVADSRPKSYYLKYLILNIASVVAIAVGFVIGVFIVGFGLLQIPARGLRGVEEFFRAAYVAAAIMIVSVIAAYILMIFGAVNLRRSYGILSDLTRIGMFGTAGFLYLLGIVTAIIVIGGILLTIAMILELVAWASLPGSIEVPGAAKAEGTGS